MNIFLWILQFILALHTFLGAVWKFSNSEQTVASLKAIPHGVWMSLSFIEIIFGVALIIPIINKDLAILVPIAAICIAIEMVSFICINLLSGTTNTGEIIYWLVVALICVFMAFGRFVLKPL